MKKRNKKLELYTKKLRVAFKKYVIATERKEAIVLENHIKQMHQFSLDIGEIQRERDYFIEERDAVMADLMEFTQELSDMKRQRDIYRNAFLEHQCISFY